jgi:hypothetical protein
LPAAGTVDDLFERTYRQVSIESSIRDYLKITPPAPLTASGVRNALLALGFTTESLDGYQTRQLINTLSQALTDMKTVRTFLGDANATIHQNQVQSMLKERGLDDKGSLGHILSRLAGAVEMIPRSLQ